MIDANVPLHNVFVLRENMWEVILDSLKDSAIALPFLLVIYLLIEFLESNERAKNKTVKLLNGKFAPLVASGVGLIPQCGFSVMATDLYCQNYLKTGTLIAFFCGNQRRGASHIADKRQNGENRVGGGADKSRLRNFVGICNQPF